MKFRSSSLTKGLLVVLILTTAAGCGDEESKRELENLRQIAADTSLYPGFVQLRNSEYQKTSHASIVRCYSVRADDDDVKRYYTQLFVSRGWARPEDEQLHGFYPGGSYRLTFRKGAYAIELVHSALNDPTGECNYSLAYFWNPPTPLI